jgi:hypothetical protein
MARSNAGTILEAWACVKFCIDIYQRHIVLIFLLSESPAIRASAAIKFLIDDPDMSRQRVCEIRPANLMAWMTTSSSSNWRCEMQVS